MQPVLMSSLDKTEVARLKNQVEDVLLTNFGTLGKPNMLGCFMLDVRISSLNVLDLQTRTVPDCTFFCWICTDLACHLGNFDLQLPTPTSAQVS